MLEGTPQEGAPVVGPAREGHRRDGARRDGPVLDALFAALAVHQAPLPEPDRIPLTIDERRRCERLLRLGGAWSLYRLREGLRACLVRSEKQDHAYTAAFAEVFPGDETEQRRTGLDGLVVALPAEVVPPAPARPAPDRGERRLRAASRVLSAVGGGLLLVAVVLLIRPPRQVGPEPVVEPVEKGLVEPAPLPDTDPLARWRTATHPTHPVVELREAPPPRTPWYAWARLSAAALAGAGVLAWARRVQAERLPDPQPPAFDPAAGLLPLHLDLAGAAPPAPLLSRTEADVLAEAVGTVLAEPTSLDLDVSASVSATAAQGGRPVEIARPERVLRHVVVLAWAPRPDRPVDEELFRAFLTRGVPCHRYRLLPTGELAGASGPVFSLDRLHQRGAAAIVLVAGPAEGVDRVTGLRSFPRVALVDPTERGAWGAAQAMLDGVIPLFAADARGWHGLAGWIRSAHTYGGEARRPLPRPLFDNTAPVGTEVALGERTQRQVGRALGAALPWAAAIAANPLPVSMETARLLLSALPDLAEAAGEGELAATLRALPPGASDRLLLLTPERRAEAPLAFSGPLRAWLHGDVLRRRWPALHRGVLEWHLAALDGVQVAPGSQAELDLRLARAILRWWWVTTAHSPDEAETRAAASALRDLRGGERTRDDVLAWLGDAAIGAVPPPPEVPGWSLDTRRVLNAAWEGMEVKPWTRARRWWAAGGGMAAVALGAWGLVVARPASEGGVIELTATNTALQAWWGEGGNLELLAGPHHVVTELTRAALDAGATVDVSLAEGPGAACVEEDPGGATWLHCAPTTGLSVDRRASFDNMWGNLEETRWPYATVSATHLRTDTRVEPLLRWLFEAGAVRGAVVWDDTSASGGAPPAVDTVVRRLWALPFGSGGRVRLDMTGVRLSLTRLRIAPRDFPALPLDPGGVDYADTAAQLLLGRLPEALISGLEDGARLAGREWRLRCLDPLGQETPCRVDLAFEGSPGMVSPGVDVSGPGGSPALAMGDWRYRALAGEWPEVTGAFTVAGTGGTELRFGAPRARIRLPPLDAEVTATLDHAPWDGRTREVDEGLHPLELHRGCATSATAVVVGAETPAPQGAFHRVPSGLPDLQMLKVDAPAPLTAVLEIPFASDLPAAWRQAPAEVRLDGARLDGARLNVEVLPDRLRIQVTLGGTRCGAPPLAVTMRPTAGPGEVVLTSTLSLVDGQAPVATPFPTLTAPVVPPPTGPRSCDGGPLPEGGRYGDRIRINLDGFDAPMEFVQLSGGRFAMGSPAEEADRDEDETCHRVTVSPFAVATTEVTQAQWKAVLGTDPSERSFLSANLADPSFPVQNVSWCDAVTFANALSTKAGRTPAYTIAADCATTGTVAWDRSADGFRLLTEAEWEYAARGGTADTFTGTSDPVEVCGYANVADATAKGTFSSFTDTFACDDGAAGLLAARSKTSNPYGLYEMGGNVYEWVWDRYGTYPTTTVRDPLGASSGAGRVIRGGSWDSGPRNARVALRDWFEPDLRRNFLGVRLALPPASRP